jgi:hypothetical protein
LSGARLASDFPVAQPARIRVQRRSKGRIS